MPDYTAVKSIRDFKSLVRYLQQHLDWPIEESDIETGALDFEYKPEDLGLHDKLAVKITEIKQIRPLVHGQQWGVFWISFESKRLPIVVMRRILAALVYKKRANGRIAKQATWGLRDLMFISATGETNGRGVSFAHFRELSDGTHQLRTFSWDAHERHFYYLEKLNLEALRWPDDTKDINGWRKRWSEAFTTVHKEVITTSQELASRMAELASTTRALVKEVYEYEKPGEPLHELYDAFKRALIHDLTVNDFADMYAQTVAYGLFSAATTPHTNDFTLENAVELIPNTNPFLRKLFAECLRVGISGRHQIDLDELGVGALMELLNNVNIEAILQDFGRQTRGADPIIYFYEAFLHEYDPEVKIKRGEFYTPAPVVSFIVRSIDCLLRAKFDCSEGLADNGRITWKGKNFPCVQILDPAIGTGTFLKYVIERIHDTFCEKNRNLSLADRRKKWNDFVSQHILPQLHGFELMMAPYTIAHMNLGLVLKRTGYDFVSEERLRVYLTNTLQSIDEIPRIDTPFIANEAEEANTVKTKVPITVVLGNPPYAGQSANSSLNSDGSLNFIGGLLHSYYEVDGKPLDERNPKWLQDDYVKFIRWGQWRIEQTGVGILAMITNHGYLDNPTFRGMRQQLMQTFSEIYILDLHGNAKKRETAPDGSKDENVFDIQQGVAICLMVRRASVTGATEVFHADLYGTREVKYDWLMNKFGDVSQVEWKKVNPQSPMYLFKPQDINLLAEYEHGWKITDVMSIHSNGIVSARDSLTIHWSERELLDTVRNFISLPPEAARKNYDLGEDTRDWKVSFAQQDIRACRVQKNHVVPVLYRPFDIRYTFYTGRSRGFICMPRNNVMRNMLGGKNLGLITSRMTKGENFKHMQVTRNISEAIVMSPNTSNNGFLFPLYIFPSESSCAQEDLLSNNPNNNVCRRSNISPKFIKHLEETLDLKFIAEGTGDLKLTFGPEDIFHYIYSVFHSPTYRERYVEFLKIDFPRLPVANNLGLFRQLVAKGKDLVILYLLESPVLNKLITKFVGTGNDEVVSGYPKYKNETVWINATQGFEGVPPNVWEFHIGGYQVCQKWLKERQRHERTLSAEDKAHYAKIVVALNETIRLMGEIDSVIEEYGGWPGAFSLSGKKEECSSKLAT